VNVKLRTAGDLMTSRVLTIDGGETLLAAAAKMDANHVHCLLVPTSERARCVGIITVKDIVQVLCEGDTSMLEQLLVADAMSAPAMSVQREFLIVDCLRLMRSSGVRSAPVLEGTLLVGLLSFSDVLRAVAAPVRAE
jgi:CBS domain-containing protein